MAGRILAIVMLSMALAGVNAQQEAMRIVVFDLMAKSAQVEADSAMLSEMLRNEFIKTGRFEVVSREQTARIMAEAEFQSVGLTSETEAIKIGQLLNVRRAIVGSVGVLGDAVFVTIQLFDLETGRFITAESIEAPGIKDVVSRMRGTVAVLTDAVYGTKTASAAGPAAEPPVSGPARAEPAREKAAAGAYPRLINYVGYATAAAGLGAVAVGYFVFDAAALEAYESAVTAKAAYDEATEGFSELWDAYQGYLADVEANGGYRMYSYIAGGVLAAGGLVMALLPPPGADRAMLDRGLWLAVLPSGVLVTLSY